MSTRCLWQGEDTSWKLQKVFPAKAETPPHLILGLRFFGLSVTCWLKGRDNPHAKLGLRDFWLSVPYWSKGGDNPLNVQSWDLGFLDSVLLADQKVETAFHPKLGLRFSGLRVTWWSKGGDNSQSAHPMWRLRVFGLSVTCWLKCRDTPLSKVGA